MFVGDGIKHISKSKIDDIDIATIFTPEELKDKFKDTDFKFVKQVSIMDLLLLFIIMLNLN